MQAIPADIDGDADMDVLCMYVLSNTPFQVNLVWFENDSAGNFGAQQVINNNDNGGLIGVSRLLTDDLDGDNDQDIIIGYGNDSKIAWLKNIDGNGTYSVPTTISILAHGLTAIAASDIDNDGDKDIVATPAADNQVVWYQNLDGLGNFSEENIIVSNATATNALAVADINNDNTNDIIYTSTNEIGWLSNTNGMGSFGNQQIITNKAFGVRSVIMADLDGDGKQDLISASRDDDKVAWYKNIDGTGNFGRQVVIGRAIEFANFVYPGDFDGDNDVDLLVNSQHDAKLTWFENVNGIGFYGKQHIITEDVGVGNFTPVAYPADLDGDGDLDIAASEENLLLWYENVDGQGNFTAHEITTAGPHFTIIRTQDMDGDGDIDMVCGVFSADRISWFENLGSGSFAPEQVITDTGGDNGSLSSMEIADMDGDSDMDIIGSNYNWDVFYFRNEGAGNFTEPTMFLIDKMYSVYPADIDGDGDKDIVGVSASGGGGIPAVVWYKNTDGLATFSDAIDISTLTVQGLSIHAADMDNDGDMDVLTAGCQTITNGQLAWYQNDGSGTFADRQMIHELFNSALGMCVATADVDNDNDMDVLAVFGYSGVTYDDKVSVFENLGAVGNTIYGTVLIDSDSNGCTDADIKGSNLMVISDNGSNTFATFTDQNGAYHVAATEGDFTSSISSQLPDYFFSAPASHAFSFSGVNNTYAADFCVAPVGGVSDLDIAIYPLQNLRPGVDIVYRVVYRNKGTTTTSGTIDFEYDNNKINFLSASQSVSAQTPNTLAFDFAGLNLFETRTIDLHFHVFTPPVTNIMDEVAATATVNPVSGDETPGDNSFPLSQTVSGSYDPNDITCLEGSQVLIADADKFLHYIIRFQNTGTASAINVKVASTLDPKLDWTSMQLESMSHNGRVEINDGSDLRFIFDNINLSDSTADEPNSHGFITYKIKPLNNVAVGDVVHSTADIYFDFNPPIVTNTTSTQFVQLLSVRDVVASKFNIYPNPTSSLLNIRANTMLDKVSVIDVNGRILKEFHFNTPTFVTQLDVTDITNGIYFLKIKSTQGEADRKFIKR